MVLTKLYDQAHGVMKVAGLISGSGSNLRKIIEHQRELQILEGSPYEVVVIFSDNHKSNALEIGKDHDIPVVTRDIRAFYKARGKPRRDLTVRTEYDSQTVQVLSSFNVNVAAYAGYMSIATEPLINAFLGVNVHPADLSITEGDERKYTGDHAVRDAILAGEKQIRSSIHIIENRVDYGRILMISQPTLVNLPGDFDRDNEEQVNSVSDQHQDKLKEFGDWIIFPKTLEHLARGRYSRDEQGNLFFDSSPVPFGIKL